MILYSEYTTMKSVMRATDLIAALETERERRGLNHHAFSTLLGIHDSYWHRLRTGERAFNLNTLTLVMQNLPGVTPEVTDYIVQQGQNHPDNTSSTTHPKNPNKNSQQK